MIANLLQEFAAPLSTEQVNKVKDAIGDLSIEQVNWLSGYLAGLAATGSAVGLKDVSAVVGQAGSLEQSSQSLAQKSALQTPTSQQKQRVVTSTILYASQTGNARGVAEKLYQFLLQANNKAVLVDVADYNPKLLKKEQRVFLITSTHGEGEPPDDAIELHEFINSKKAPDLSSLEFAVLSLGDSSYEYFCQTGKDFDEAFARLGGKRLFDRVDCDVDYLNETQAWSKQVLEHLERENNLAECSTNASVNIATEQAPHLRVVEPDNSSFDKFNPYPAKVLDVVSITASGSTKPTLHVEVDLEESGLTYQPGDALGVWPVNQDELVKQTLNALSLDGTVEVTVGEETKSLFEALKNDLELTQVGPQFVSWLANFSGSSELISIAQDRAKLSKFILKFQVPELLAKYFDVVSRPSFDAQTFISQLRRITPRLYSIASSQDEVDEEVHLTVGLVREFRNGSERNGAASTLLSQLQTDDVVKVFVEKNKNFKLPENSSTKIIMVGAGTGIAPYRGFMQQRAADNAAGNSWLIFGNPHFSTDFLYQLEWQQYLKKGVLSKIDLAFSRDQSEKVYVQDKIREHSKAIYEWIQEGAHLYVCGNKDRLGQAVENAFIEVLKTQGDKTEEQAKATLTEMKKAGRYQKDVY
ncbi:assimilatory sulfite reductase (NADPH) flavoprotein subunit [Pleionea sediminis]|uniref:assimilatory sulfite reductase (NADPH) flavoprotein subunit n=1 Tax=Pleionea sediminis TaxID=2569479 RepID=UPI00118624CC|nr:assimilatory sulfite reductase (NADPH) flavoprotein subunit [Pleionea sediminis]